MFLHCKLLRHSFCNTASSPNRVKPWLFIGLGNLGEKYQSTRHDVGFDMIDAFAQAQDIPMTFIHFKALFGEGMVGDTPVLLAKPQTYMNLSGESQGLTEYFNKCNCFNLESLDGPWHQ
ncbi:CRS2-like protein, chloroplastic [Curcuma longa]|uniref:CRS2-like protein, chloroplastic n=1 Tax=Curcuma longa TaxID=136217 RepID=UPI003D9E77DE